MRRYALRSGIPAEARLLLRRHSHNLEMQEAVLQPRLLSTAACLLGKPFAHSMSHRSTSCSFRGEGAGLVYSKYVESEIKDSNSQGGA